MKNEFYKDLAEHSKVKERLLGKYFEAYTQVLGHNRYTDCVAGFDLFAGKGIYEDGEHGSPMIIRKAMEITANTLAAKGKSCKFELYANDHNPEHTASLEASLKDSFPNGKVFWEVSNRDYQDCLESVAKLAVRRKTKSFIFLDPFGYKNISITDIATLLSSGNAELLLWLPITHMARFSRKETPAALQRIQDQLGIADSDFESLEGKNHQREYIHLVVEKLRSYFPQFYVDSFFIRAKPSVHHAMFFITPSAKGAEKLIEAKWTIDEDAGEGWSYKKASMESLFGASQAVNRLEQLLVQKGGLLRKGTNNVELYAFSIRNGYLPKHINQVLKEMDRLTWTHPDPTKRARKNATYINYENFRNTAIKVNLKLPAQ